MFIVYNARTRQIVGWNPNHITCDDPLICVPVPFVSEPLSFFSFSLNNEGEMHDSLLTASLEDVLIAEDCLDFNDGSFPIYCSVYARDKNEAIQKATAMISETGILEEISNDRFVDI